MQTADAVSLGKTFICLRDRTFFAVMLLLFAMKHNPPKLGHTRNCDVGKRAFPVQ